MYRNGAAWRALGTFRHSEHLHHAAELLQAESKKLLEKNLEANARIHCLQGRKTGALRMRIARLV